MNIPKQDILKSNILITGGTGSFGQAMVRRLLALGPPKRLVVLSRDEQKQHAMEQAIPHKSLRFFLGDVRDPERLQRAFHDIDYVVHTAALKHVHLGEYNPTEVIRTNVGGAENVINAALDQGVKRVVALSTDKAANPINLYGATKLCSDKLFIAANSYSGSADTTLAVVRYGNVIGSRGSVIPLFLGQAETGVLTVTDERMTRFMITIDRGVDLVLHALADEARGVVYVPKIPSVRVIDLARTIGRDCEVKTIGIRPGEKLHEIMITSDDARMTVEFDDHYVIRPANFPRHSFEFHMRDGKEVPEDFVFDSFTNPWYLDEEGILKIVDEYQSSPHMQIAAQLVQPVSS